VGKRWEGICFVPDSSVLFGWVWVYRWGGKGGREMKVGTIMIFLWGGLKFEVMPLLCMEPNIKLTNKRTKQDNVRTNTESVQCFI